jgi:hypothetical protein
MKIMTSTVIRTSRYGMRFTNAVALFTFCGCAHLATVKETRPRVPAVTASEEQLQAAIEHLSRAEREQPFLSLGDDLAAAKLSLSILERQPSDSSAQTVYNFAVARTVENVERANQQPWRRSSSVPSNQVSFLLTTPKPIDSEHDPSRYDLFPTDTLKIGGTFFKTRSAVSGIGAPLVAVARKENPERSRAI